MEVFHKPGAHTVFAPKDGIIATVFAPEGTEVKCGGCLFEISTLQEKASVLQIETVMLSSQLLLDRITGDRLKDFTDNAASSTNAAISYLDAVQEHCDVVADLVPVNQALQVDLMEIQASRDAAKYIVEQSKANQEVMDADVAAMRHLLQQQLERAREKLKAVENAMALAVVNAPVDGVVTWHSHRGGYVPGGAPVCDLLHK